MKTSLFLLLAFAGAAVAAQPTAAPTTAVAPDGNAGFRLWHDNAGLTVAATFRGLEDGNVFLQLKNGDVKSIPLERLTADDQQAAKTMKPEGLGIPTYALLAQAAAKIDAIVLAQLTAKGEKPNALASDEQFVRRVYLDLVGRIPTREEIIELLEDTSPSKRGKVIDKLVKSDGFTSHMFNYFSDMLRMSDDAQKAKFFTYEEWFKDQLAKNRPYNQIVYDMISADGKLLENGAAGYLLRDKGMRLDNLSITLTTFLGANVSCAQCHDHPFAEWTQKQFYEMAAFFGATETYEKKGGYGMKGMAKDLTPEELKKLKRIAQINALDVRDIGKNEVKLPDDYKYKNASPGEMVLPKLITWDMKSEMAAQVADGDVNSPTFYKQRVTKLYGDVNTAMAGSHPTAKGPVKPVVAAKGKGKNAASAGVAMSGTQEWRHTFAKWMTSPDNPRFAMTIANRLWKNVFGVAVKEPISDLDDISSSNNPMLLYHLEHEMVRLKFDLRAFMRLLCNTQTYQREAITKQVTPGEPYYFPGPILRRMTAEQAWDSCVTLAIGEKVDGYKLHRAENYVATTDLKPNMSASDIRVLLANVGKGKLGGGKGKANAKKLPDSTDEGDVDHKRPEVLQGLVLARASELPQPEKDQHFLRMFGQSDRQISDSNADEGSIPQVLMFMNGEAQRVLRNPKSRVLATAMDQKTPEAKVESLYLSFFGRHPNAQEAADAKASIASGMTVSDLTWVLFNAREFVFVQ